MKENVNLAQYTTMRVGGNARYFFSASTIEDVRDAVIFAQEKSLPIFILGGGSNVLISDEGFTGVVIRIQIKGIEYENIDKDSVRVTVGAGESWDALVEEVVKKELYGVENLSLIPGSVGASPVQNIGAYGAEVAVLIRWVEVFDIKELRLKKLSNEECSFGYRNSIFKTSEGSRYIVTKVMFYLKKNGSINTSYKEVSKYFKEHNTKLTIESMREAIIAIRSSKLPDIKKIGTCGSFFKNPIISKLEYDKLIEGYPETPCFTMQDGSMKCSAAWMLDSIGGWKNFREGSVGTHSEHALVIVNHKDATSSDVKNLAEKMRDSIKKKTGITLEYEVVIL